MLLSSSLVVIISDIMNVVLHLSNEAEKNLRVLFELIDSLGLFFK
ncbi:hypothetical protein Ark11_1105 [Candidatus Ichthyocystis hellenicum]|uniref:Uncharacterized protein n=1 Tax=Candidatus Ichthyocystis hellenicum TaxID=1561003 RepID=A0A0S4M2K4_9BURK|nr:hypothetical protein [Candidatus Ichthyocystis hellenicum]CUT17918.1 hypothetical protein Ark11_1105 [Candidatus Ichthyocystis hellenicum]